MSYSQGARRFVGIAGMGQAADMTFSLAPPTSEAERQADTSAAAWAAAHPSTTPSTTPPAPSGGGGKTGGGAGVPTPSYGLPSGGKTGGSSWGAPPTTPSAYPSYPTASGGGSPSWMPWAIGGGVALLGIGLVAALAR